MFKINKQLRLLLQIITPFMLLTISSNAYAVRWVGEMGIHTGGDKLASATYTNGDTSSIKAGALVSFGIGPQFDLSENTNIRTTIGIKGDSVTADNGSIDFIRFPIDVMYFYTTENWMLGAGVTYHISPELSGDGIASKVSGDFDNALGFLAEVDFRLGEFFYLGGKLTFIDYEPTDVGSGFTTVDGNSVGVVIGFIFGDK